MFGSSKIEHGKETLTNIIFVFFIRSAGYFIQNHTGLAIYNCSNVVSTLVFFEYLEKDSNRCIGENERPKRRRRN